MFEIICFIAVVGTFWAVRTQLTLNKERKERGLAPIGKFDPQDFGGKWAQPTTARHVEIVIEDNKRLEGLVETLGKANSDLKAQLEEAIKERDRLHNEAAIWEMVSMDISDDLYEFLQEHGKLDRYKRSWDYFEPAKEYLVEKNALR